MQNLPFTITNHDTHHSTYVDEVERMRVMEGGIARFLAGGVVQTEAGPGYLVLEVRQGIVWLAGFVKVGSDLSDESLLPMTIPIDRDADNPGTAPGEAE